jgi:hypothetical protein
MRPVAASASGHDRLGHGARDHQPEEGAARGRVLAD